MKTENTVSICGSITKTESLIPITSNILKNSWVAEANLPYAGYYGSVPEKINPNSLFLFTKWYYPLEEILRFSQGIKKCNIEKVDIASALLEFRNKQYPAIRVKYFPDYQHLHLLQSCFTLLGVEFAEKIHSLNSAKTIINKCFVMKKLEEGIYFDEIEENKGYFFMEKRIDRDNFRNIVKNIKNNSNCRYFDAVLGITIKNSKPTDFIRIYSDGLNPEILKCIINLFQKEYL